MITLALEQSYADMLAGIANEDLTTYEESDPDGRLVVDSASQVTVTSLNRTEADYLASVKATNFFAGDFIVRFKLNMSAVATNHISHLLTIAPITGGRSALGTTLSSYLSLVLQQSGSSRRLLLRDYVGDGNVYSDTGLNMSLSTDYYIEMRHSLGVFTIYIYTDAGYTTLFDTLTRTQTNKAYNVIYAVMGNATTTSGTASFVVSNLQCSVPQLVTLPNPQLGDSEQRNIPVSVRHSMDGTLHSIIKTTAYSKFLLDFPLISQTEKNTFLAFMESYAGENVYYTNWRTPPVTSKVKILNAPVSFREHKNGYAFTLELIEV